MLRALSQEVATPRRRRSREELADCAELIEELRARARQGPLTIVYAARDQQHNNAVVLAELLRDGQCIGRALRRGDRGAA